ncbi:MAG: DUF3883 domain-containing protein [Clostridia bacterium]|nr:DUF3883 domain-containing protein [Clostridia bacterium]
MFFKLHDENRIGYKELTDADLGRSTTSHQTHIGLFDDVLTFLPNNASIDDSMMIYDNNIDYLSLNFDRIENPDHSFRSPKIRCGNRNEISVVTYIRDKSKSMENSVKWYLFWFGLESGQTVFFLFNDKSQTFNEISALGINLVARVKNRLTPADNAYSTLLNYLENLVNKTGAKVVQDLEVVAQTDKQLPNKKYRDYDVNKAKEIFAKIGKEGEFLVNQYFATQKQRGLISNYKWVNEKEESGLPYDFFFETLQGEIIYLDVKTTNYQFSQKMVFSSQEIGFAMSELNKYCIYRVYKDENGKHCLKICSNTRDLFTVIQNKTTIYENDLVEFAIIESIKMAINPTQALLDFSQPIVLTA